MKPSRRRFHIICGVCGEATDIGFNIPESQVSPDEWNDCGSGVTVECGNCSQIESIESVNEVQKEHQ